MTKPIEKIEYGDFQTPYRLAEKIVCLLKNQHRINADVIIEPTCGIGAFIVASCKFFSKSAKIYGFDINQNYINRAKKQIQKECNNNEIYLKSVDFFSFNWNDFLVNFGKNKRVLILGNPPWVTSSDLGTIGSKNIPKKENFEQERGIDAITGASNFDLSEWMILQYLNWLSNRKGTIAQLCKYAVARKILKRLEKDKSHKYSAHIYPINAQKEFGVSVEACLFILNTESKAREFYVYESLDSHRPLYTIGERDGLIVRDISKYDKYNDLLLVSTKEQKYIWRTGIKHDCSKIMELEKISKSKYINGKKQIIELEDSFIYPLLKSSDVANNRVNRVRKYVIITQKKVGEDTEVISEIAPKMWRYLLSNESCFNKRKSTIYKNKPKFSIFGVGEYTFKPWKIAISSLYKKLNFVLIGPIENKTVAFDDTVNFLSFDTEEEANFIYSLLTSEIAINFLDSMIFWDEKRPVSVKILRKLDFRNLAHKLGKINEYEKFQVDN